MTTYEPADWRPEPGDVAMVTYDGSESVRVMDRQRRWWGSTNGFLWTENLKRARRLLVVDPASTVALDPDNPDDVQRLKQALSRWESDRLNDLLRSLLPFPTQPEPNGLGAVVVDADDEWVRTSGDKGAVARGCCPGRGDTMTELTDTERERLAEPMYAAYRLGKYAPAEYLPMWHELDQKPTSTPEHEELYAVVGDMLAAARAEGARDMRTKIEALPDQMAAVWGGDDPWLTTGNRVAELVRDWLNEALADGGEPQ